MAAPQDDDTRTVRVRIEGRVQGVGFRYWTEATATGLGLSGWVRNRRDGSVEAVFSGPVDTVAEMLELCRQGPTSSRIARIHTTEEPDPPPAGFDVKPTV
jgi:acylphosphatase